MVNNERVIVVKGNATQWFDQAIFIINKKVPQEKMPVDLVAEAEMIINHYIIRKNNPAISAQTRCKPAAPVQTVRTRHKTKTKRFDFFLNAIMLMGCMTIAIVFLFGLLGHF